MPCMCGDYLCPSCGSAMGYDPTFELICEWLGEVVFPELPESINAEWFIEEVADKLGRNTNQEVVDVITEAAKAWDRENQAKARRKSNGNAETERRVQPNDIRHVGK